MTERSRRAGSYRVAGALLALAVFAVFAVFAGASAAGAPRSGRRSTTGRSAALPALRGVNVIGLYAGARPAVADREIDQARALHANVVRAELRWSALEPARPGQIEPAALAFTDRLVADAAAAGIRVIFTVDSSPCWDTTAPRALLARCVPAKATQANSWPPATLAPYASVVEFIARRYGTELAAIEIWNEPDQSNQLYFAGPNKVQRYAALLRAAYSAIKQANPAVQVLGGSLVGSNGKFLRALYAAGIKGYYDGLAVHFYSLVLGSLRAIHQVQVANGDARPLWLDEFGWTSCFPHQLVQEEQACVTESAQARNVANVTHSLAQTPWLAAEVVYNLEDSAGQDFGLIAPSGIRKAAFGALAKAFLAPSQRADGVKVALIRRGRRLVASGSGPVGDYMQLEAFVSGALRYRVLFVLDRFNRYRIALPAVLGTRGVRVRVFQYWAGATRAASASR
jgi:hypothetical protein